MRGLLASFCIEDEKKIAKCVIPWVIPPKNQCMNK